MSETFTFTFDGKTVTARPGQSLAAALTEAGIRSLRETPSGRERGVFCGMGVCQDCLVEVDGIPNRRACMTKVQPGLAVRRQEALPRLGELPRRMDKKTASRIETPDVTIVGGGAGGLAAAIAASQAGADVLVIDERGVAGGQFYKQTAVDTAETFIDSQQKSGNELLSRAQDAGVRFVASAEVWGAFHGPVLHAETPGGALTVRPKALIVAAGAYERPIMIPGWDLPGVMTTGAAQTLWRSYRTLPGKRIAIAGNGPLNFQVARELIRGGAEMAVIAEAAPQPWTRPGAGMRMFAADPQLTLAGASTLAWLIAHGAAPRFGARPTAVEETGKGLRITITSNGDDLECFDVDVLCMNDGFHPQNEILRLLGVRMDYDPTRGQLVPKRDENMQTSVAGIYAVGDCCGLGGAPAAQEEGYIAGAAAAAAMAENVMPASQVNGHRKRLGRHRSFQAALWTMFAAPRTRFEDIAPEVLICRCEEVQKQDLLDPASQAGAQIGTVKRSTRLGMGRCQGRYCSQVVAPYLAQRQGQAVEDRSFFAPRVPVKPVAIATILAAGEAEHDD